MRWPFQHALDRYKYPSRYDGCDPIEHRLTGTRYLRTLKALLNRRPACQVKSPVWLTWRLRHSSGSLL